MILTKLTLKNFRQFYGDVDIEFSTDPTKNITLIHAENGVGKTTLLNAIRWCLYGSLSSGTKLPDLLVCEAAVKEGVYTCHVELSFEHDSSVYIVRRVYEQRPRQSKLRVMIDDPVKGPTPVPSESQARLLLNSIVPEEIAEYFFFHGEGITKINDSQAGVKFRRAIRDIMGFRLVEQAISDLRELRRVVSKELAGLSSLSEEQRQARKQMVGLEDKLSDLQEANEITQGHVAKLEHELEVVSEEIRTSGVKDAQKLQNEVDKRKPRLIERERQLMERRKERAKLIQRAGWSAFFADAGDLALSFIDETTLRGKIPAPYDQTFVDDLMSQGECVCGRPLHPGTEPHAKVLALLSSASTGKIKARLMKARSVGSMIRTTAASFAPELARVEDAVRSFDADIHTLRTEIEELEGGLHRIDAAKIKVLIGQQDALKIKVTATKERSGAEKTKISNLKLDIAELQKKIERSTVRDEREVALGRRQALITKLIDWAVNLIEKREALSKLEIGKAVNAILSGFSRKDYAVKIQDDFNFHLVKSDGSVVAQSTGENLLLNLIFVSALIDFVREQDENRKGRPSKYLSIGTAAPFVIDAPFGELDETYKSIVAEFIPDRARQVVFLLSSSHWGGAVDKAISGKVGKEFVLVSHKTSEKGTKPEDAIRIRNKDYVCSRYGQPKERTEVVEVLHG